MGGLPVDDVGLGEAVERVAALVARGRGQIVPLNAAKAGRCRRDPALHGVVSGADLVVVDGAAVAWCAGRTGSAPRRITGIDLLVALLDAARTRGWRVALVGGRIGVAERVAARWPDVDVALAIEGYLSDARLAAAIGAARPDLVFLGLGTPRQERLGAALAENTVTMGVGGSFDVLSGRISRAPDALRRRGLEWAWRAWQEPRRLASAPSRDALGFLVGALVRPAR